MGATLPRGAGGRHPERFRLHGVTVKPGRNGLEGADGSHKLEPKVMDVLCCLACHPDRTLSRDEIITEVWGLRFGGDESLTRAVSQIRKGFRCVGADASPVETVAKRGYRLRGTPEPVPVEDICAETAMFVSDADGQLVITVRRSALAFALVALLVATQVTVRFAPDVADGLATVIAHLFESEPSETVEVDTGLGGFAGEVPPQFEMGACVAVDTVRAEPP